MRPPRRAAPAALLLLLAAGCGGGMNPGGGAPPPLRVVTDDGELTLTPYTWCYRSTCVDGAAPTSPPDVGAPATLVVRTERAGWTVTAELTPPGGGCPVLRRTLVADGDAWRLDPAGPAGRYDVTLTAQDGDGSDQVTAVRWTTSVDGTDDPDSAPTPGVYDPCS